MDSNEMQHSKIALVLGSGAARGLAHIGVLKVLDEIKFPINMIVGTSMGALIAGAYAAGISAKRMEKIACETNWLRVAKMLFPRRLQREGLLDGKGIEEFLITLVGEQKIEDLKIPFAAVATDIWTGDEIILRSGSLVKAIRASISFPFLFVPVNIDGHFLVDGGVVNPLPINVAQNMGADFIIGVRSTPTVERQIQNSDVGQMLTEKQKKTASNSTSVLKQFSHLFHLDVPYNKKESSVGKNIVIKPGLRQQAIQVATIMENKILTLHLEDSPADLLITPSVDNFQFMDFTRAWKIIETGEKAARFALKNNSVISKLQSMKPLQDL